MNLWGLTFLLFLAGTLQADPHSLMSEYERNIQSILDKASPRPDNDHEREAYWRQILSGNPDAATRYSASQALNITLRSQGRDSEGHSNCQKVPPHADDFEAQAICVSFIPGLSDSARTDMFEKIFLEARQHKPGTIPAMVMNRAAFHLIFAHDFPRAVSLLKQALETVPMEARDMQAYLKKNIGIIYIVPSNSLEVVKQGIKLFDEMEEYFLGIGDWERAENAAYNKSIAMIMSLKDYKGALHELQKVQKDVSILMDAQVFRAFSLAKLGRHEEADRILDQIDLSDYPDEDRQPFLNCYAHMARNLSLSEASIESCTQLPKDTQSDVILHITEELKQRNLKASDELQLLQQFYWFYQNRLVPSIRITLEKTLDGLELQRTRYESRLKDAELRTQKHNSQLKTYALVGSIILLCVFIASWHRILRQNRKIRRLNLYIQKQVLQRFLPPEIIQEILDGRNRLDESARTMSVTVLFADLCSFTQQSENLGPQKIAFILNAYLVRMTEVIFEHGGTIDKFIGDGIMVIFGAPTEMPEPQQATKAMECALHMQRALQELSRDWESHGYPGFKMRIGIHQGQAVVGSFGGPQRSDFTVIGSTVNISSRIENMANPSEILISREIARYLPRDRVISTGIHKLRGLEESQELFILKELRWQSVS